MVCFGLASAAVILAIPDPRGRLVDDADRFAVRLASARDYAVIEARPVAVWVSPTAYGFALYRDGQWIDNREGHELMVLLATASTAQAGQTVELN